MGELFHDVWRNLFVIFVVMVSFAAALTGLEAEGYEELGDSTWKLGKTLLYLEAPELGNQGPFAVVLIVAYVIIVSIGLLSILIAQLSYSYNQLSVDKSGMAKMNRAYVCVEVESTLSLAYRKRIFSELGFDNSLDFDNGDQGPPGGVQVMEPASVRAHPKYCPDRIQRSTGSVLPTDPWPQMTNAADDEDEKAESRR